MTLLDERERVAITFTLGMDYIPVEKILERGQLRVDVLDATYPGRPVDREAYCEFYLNEQILFKTSAIKKLMRPVWNDFFVVEIRSRIDAMFRVTLHEIDDRLRTKIFVGNAVIDLQRLEPCRTQDRTIYMAETSGSIRLQLFFRPE
jgi:Ca2+-dependent lipid-binding protein